MHIHIIPNRDSKPTVLLRESYREGGKVGKRTLANLSSLSADQVEAIRAVLAGKAMCPVSSQFEIVASRPHGHVQALKMAMQRLGLASLISSTASRERDLVLAMIASRILEPATKLATTRWWHTCTLAEEFGVVDADEDDLYHAMDWLLERQDKIQSKLAKRHLQNDGLVLYDLSSSYLEGEKCPLGKLGYSRDGKHGMLQVNYGLLTDARGCPVAVSVHPGNTSDSKTFMPEVARLRDQFQIERIVIAGDRGMISEKSITEMRAQEGIDWITALKSVSIRSLLDQGQIQLDLFDESNLFEMNSPEFPDERLIACRNPQLAKLRAHKREALLQATEEALAKIRDRISNGRLTGAAKIGVAVGKIINRFKVAKHFDLDISDSAFTFQRNPEKIASETALDGIYIIRTSLEKERMNTADCVRSYKSLANVERAFRSLKTMDLKVRPIHHHLATRVRTHIFLCMLAYYVEWHLRDAWREIMFADTEQQDKLTRDPIAPAKRSKAALDKVQGKQLEDGTSPHSFATLLALLGTITRNRCRSPGADATAPTFDLDTKPNAKQVQAFALLEKISP